MRLCMHCGAVEMNGTDNQATMTVPGYESLADVLQRAYDQAAKGKGADRHAGARPFTEIGRAHV